MLITLPPLDRPYQSHVCLFFVTILFIGYQNDHAKFFFEKMFTVTFDSFFLCDVNDFDKIARKKSPALQSQIFHRRYKSNLSAV